jgi:hypothetical protein
MNSRPLRVFLLLAALAAVAAATFVVFSAERSLAVVDSAGERFDAQSRAVTDEVARLREAQQAYVAEGQGVAYWMAQAAERLASVDRGVAELATASSSDATRSAVQAAAAALEQFRELDKRARQYVQNGQNLVASDVIFTESLAALTAATGHVVTAADNERALRAAEAHGRRQRQFYAAGGAAAVLLLVVLLLVPVPEADVDVLTAMRALTESAPKAQPAAAAKPKVEIVYGDEESTARLLPRQAAEPPAAPSTPPPASAPAAAAAAPVPTGPPDLNLTAAAEVCADLARVLDAGDIPALLSRAAGVLDARGMIVWVADRSGASLYPMFTHGYPSAVILRLGTIGSDANNATAAAWRSGELTAVAGGDGQSGALVTPIVTAEGCVGVLAAEIADGREMRDDVRALATIFSAQLATVVTPVAEASQAGLADRVATQG